MTDVAHPVSLVSVPDPRDRANTGGEPAGRIVLPYLLFGLAFLAAIVAFVGRSQDPDAAAWVAASLFFLAVSAVLLLALVRREFRRRRVVETSVAELDNALTAVGRLTANLAEVAHHEMLETVLERVANALGADRVTVHLDGNAEGVSWGAPPNGTDAVTFPMPVQGRVIGALEVAIHDRRRLGGRETQLLRIVAGRLASVVEQRRLFLAEHRALEEAQLARDELELAAAEAEQRAVQLQRLTEASIALAASPNPREVVAIAAEQARRVLDAQAAEVVVFCGDAPPMRQTSGTRGAGDSGGTTGLTAPLTGRCTGVVSVVPKHADSFTAHDESILTSFAQTVSVSLANADLYEEARRSEARRAAAVDESPLGILEIDAAGAVVRANRSAQAILGWPSSSATTAPEPPFDAATQVTVTELCQRAMAGDTVIGVDVPAQRLDGTPIDLSISAAPVCGSDGPPQLVVVVLADMTERHHLERQLSQAARLESLGRLAGGVAHDFNNLLTVILGYTELVLNRLGENDDGTRADLEAVCRAGEQAKALTNQLLTLSRRRVTAPVVLDPNEIVDSIGGVLRRLVGTSVEIHVDADEDAGWVEIDRGQLEQVLLNLAVNGRDAMPDGGELRIVTRPGTMSVTGAPAVVLEVSDTGMGMDAPTADQCFDPFFTTKERQGGTGLGLSMVYGAVTQAGGHISVQSEPGRGSTFVIELPRVSAPGEITDQTSRIEVGPGARILLVEDEEPVRRLARHMLEEHGYKVVEAASGAEALLAARIGKPPELLLTDVVMPGMSGAELARRWYELLPDTPVLFISGYADEDALRLVDGMRCLQKPFRAQELLAAVRETLTPAVPVGSGQSARR